MQLYGRQGDLVFERCAHPAGVQLSARNNYVLAGHQSSPHVLRGEALVCAEGRTTLLRLSGPRVVEHAGRHTPITLPPGDYRVSPLRERGAGSDREVED